MPILEGFRIQNYRALKDVTLGRLWNQQDQARLTPLVAVIGKNGAGKTTLFDAFGFLSDCLAVGIEEACDLRDRGGFQKLRSAGSDEPIRFEVYYRASPSDRPITYELAISLDHRHRPYVVEERLRQRRKGQKRGRPFSFLYLHKGKGLAWTGAEMASSDLEDLFDQKQLGQKVFPGKNEEIPETVEVELNDVRQLGIATLGSLKNHKRIAQFREFLQGWYLSYFSPDAARTRPKAGPQSHLNGRGDNLANVVQYMEREHPKKFKRILENIAGKIPGITAIKTERTRDGYLLLCFYNQGFPDPFFVQQMSDGTLKLFTYYLLLESSDSASFICIEEPENGLYHKVLSDLVHEFRQHATAAHAPQLFITTHQPYLVDALSPEEAWILKKGDDGFSKISRAADDPLIRNMVKAGLPLGGLWFSDYLDPR